MATAPSYATYVACGGALAEGRFLAVLPRAQAAVDEVVWPNLVTTVTQRVAYERAVCAVVDLIDSPSVTTERVGNTSVTYADVPTIAAAIRRELTGSGLLYRGL
jgi:hypothetical protein